MGERRLLAILGSPRRDGVTAGMLRCAVESARRCGWQVDQVNLYDKKIAYCRGCRACLVSGVCVQQDDAQEIAELLRRCDAVVLAAPVYWANVPAAVKNLFDRLLGTAMVETAAFPKPRLSRRQRYVLLTACHTPFPFSRLCGQSGGALRAMNEFFKTAGMTCGGRFVCPGTGGRRELPKLLEKRIERCWR